MIRRDREQKGEADIEGWMERNGRERKWEAGWKSWKVGGQEAESDEEDKGYVRVMNGRKRGRGEWRYSCS